MNNLSIEIIIGILKIFSFVVPVLVSVALLVYLERKVLGAVQLRKNATLGFFHDYKRTSSQFKFIPQKMSLVS